jgi:hypothetical protein
MKLSPVMLPPGRARRHEPLTHGIGRSHDHDGDGRRRFLGCPDGRSIHGHDHTDLEPQELVDERGKPVSPPRSVSHLDRRVPTFDVAEPLQLVPEILQEAGLQVLSEDTDSIRRRLGRGRGGTQHQEKGRQTGEPCESGLRVRSSADGDSAHRSGVSLTRLVEVTAPGGTATSRSAGDWGARSGPPM